MVKLNDDGTVDLNEFARQITLDEKGAKEVDIGQTKQIAKLVARQLHEVKDDHGIEKMLDTIKRLAG